MEFTLYYRGELHPNGSAKEKHQIRKILHIQLSRLWEQIPLADHKKYFLQPCVPNSDVGNTGDCSVIRQLGKFTFAPLVCEKLHFIGELDITLLRPEPPGTILVQSGDIDNRLKTLLDALKIPSEPNALPDGTVPQDNEEPFFCLLEDDKLVTRISISTDRLLDQVKNKFEAVVLIRVRTRKLQSIIATLGLD